MKHYRLVCVVQSAWSIAAGLFKVRLSANALEWKDWKECSPACKKTALQVGLGLLPALLVVSTHSQHPCWAAHHCLQKQLQGIYVPFWPHKHPRKLAYITDTYT